MRNHANPIPTQSAKEPDEAGACQVADFDGETLTWTELEPEDYIVSETDPGQEWTVDILGSPATVEAGQTAEVTVTNTRDAPNSITIVKDVIGDNANTAQAFQIFHNSSNPDFIPPGTTSISEDDGAVELFTNVRNNLLVQLREQNLPEDWEFVSLECVSETGDTSFSYPAEQNGREVRFTISEGDNVTCTWTNAYVLAELTIAVIIDGFDPGIEIDFTAEPPLDPTEFSLGNGENRSFSDLLPGQTYTVNEQPPEGVLLEGVDCTAVPAEPLECQVGSVSVTPEPGQSVTATFRFRFVPPVPAEPKPIPVLNGWALLGLIGLLGLVSVSTRQRR